jgi:signal peptidase I
MMERGAPDVTDYDTGAVDTTAPPGRDDDGFWSDDGDDGRDDDRTGRRSSRPPRRRKSSLRRALIEWAILIGSALVIALLIKTFLFQAFYIPSQSMYPTLKQGDRILVNKLSYRVHDVNRGDIVVFETPEGEDDNGIKDLVKRVVGLPGERVETQNGRVYVNGRLLDEPYLEDGVETCKANSAPPNCESFITEGAGYVDGKIPPGHVLVMGDNREASKDGRFFGPIEESSIVGRVFIRIWPVTDVGFL